MATSIYKKIGFEDRQDTKPDTYLVDGVPKTIEKDNSGLVQAGTNLNQENLDHMEEGILQNSRNINELDKKIGNHAELIEKNTSQLDDVAKDIGDKSTLKTTDKTNLVGAVNELFQNANNGKTLISNVVGSPLLATDTFQQQHYKIQTLLNTFATNLTAKEQASSWTEGLKSLIDKVAKINVGKKWASGTIVTVNSNTQSTATIKITGLTFKPSLIVVAKLAEDNSIRIGTLYWDSISKNKFTAPYSTIDFQSYYYVNDTGFFLEVARSTAVSELFNWIAIE